MTALNASQSNQHTGYDETCGSSFKKGLFHVLGADKRREDVLYSNLRCTASLSRLTQGTNHGPNVHSTGKGTHLMFLFFFKWIKIKSFCLTPRVKKKKIHPFYPYLFCLLPNTASERGSSCLWGQHSIYHTHLRVLRNLLDLVARIPDVHKPPNQWQIYQKFRS